mmetsp:Transcript_12350/g.26685  ORF Transcript_12350/g.26685 Transcript_12350/m.26685 type:complete len:260 (-) Transcript_12350:450-1229(-)
MGSSGCGLGGGSLSGGGLSLLGRLHGRRLLWRRPGPVERHLRRVGAHVSARPDGDEQLIEAFGLELRLLENLLDDDRLRRGEDVVEDPIETEAGGRVHCKPAEHEGQRFEDEHGRLALLLVTERLKASKQVERECLCADEDGRYREVEQRVLPSQLRVPVDPSLGQPREPLAPVGDWAREIGHPEEALVEDLCLGDGGDRVVDAEEDGDLRERRQAARERVDVEPLEERANLLVLDIRVVSVPLRHELLLWLDCLHRCR